MAERSDETDDTFCTALKDSRGHFGQLMIVVTVNMEPRKRGMTAGKEKFSRDWRSDKARYMMDRQEQGPESD